MVGKFDGKQVFIIAAKSTGVNDYVLHNSQSKHWLTLLLTGLSEQLSGQPDVAEVMISICLQTFIKLTDDIHCPYL